MKTKAQLKKEELESRVRKEKELLEKKKQEIKTTHLPDAVKKKKKRLLISILLIGISIFLAALNYIITQKIISSLLILVAVLISTNAYIIYREKYRATQRIKKIEDVFPDFVELMAANLRAGMTIDKALLVSSRKEFAPLDEEILRLGKDIMTGKEITLALYEMGERIKSEKIKKTLALIITGIASGGNLSVLLEETAMNMRERAFVEKRAASNVLMYVIFVFFAVAVGAPVLFGLSSILVKTITTIMSSVPEIDTTATANLPFTMGKINITTAFINYFAVIYLIVISVLSSLVIGIVNKGEEKSGINYIIPVAIISISIFFLIQLILSKFVLTLFS
ncbi:MAG: type II secretion system F family protein [Nanoarchaeota archaeon]